MARPVQSAPPMTAESLNLDVAADVARRLTLGEDVADETFDALLSDVPRSRSSHYWSCVAAAQEASRLFKHAGVERVLDVGSGVGKLCCVLSLSLGRRVWGLERRGELVFESRRLAQRLGAEVVVTEGELASVDASRFDGFYFFNPFGEYLADDEDRYDGAAPRSFEPYLRDARRVEAWLQAAPVGTALVTYNGLGGRIPASFSVQRTTQVRHDIMRLWVKERADDGGEALVEIEDQLVAASHLLALARSSGAGFSDSPLVAALCQPR